MQSHVNSNCVHYIIRYWEEGKRGQQAGYLNLTDFNPMVLPAESPVLRATVTQRITGLGEDVPRLILN